MRRAQRERITRAKARTAPAKERGFGQKWADMLRTALLIKARMLRRDGSPTLPDLMPNGLPHPAAFFRRPPEDIVPRSRSRYSPNVEDAKHRAAAWGKVRLAA